MSHSAHIELPTESPTPLTADNAPSGTVKVESQPAADLSTATVDSRENGIKDGVPRKESKLAVAPLVTEDAAPREQPASSSGSIVDGVQENINPGQEVQSPTEDTRADPPHAAAEHQIDNAANNVRMADDSDANPARGDGESKDGKKPIKRSSTLSTIMNAMPGYRPRGRNAPRSGAPRGHSHHSGGCVIF